jgi:hypothetical protein
MSKPQKDSFLSVSHRTSILRTVGGRRFRIDIGDLTAAICWTPTEELEIKEDEERPGAFIIRRVYHDPPEEIHAIEI